MNIKFQSKKDPLLSFFIYGIILFIIIISGLDLIHNPELGNHSWAHVINFLVIALLIWIYHGTSYKVNSDYLYYQSGPIRGKIDISSISEIKKDKTLWVGLKPATSRKGLILKYGTYDEIYISPSTNESFIKTIKELNPDVIIS